MEKGHSDFLEQIFNSHNKEKKKREYPKLKEKHKALNKSCMSIKHDRYTFRWTKQQQR